ncbi:MAG: DUF4124 domain-containing protein [Myxococcota bacterium]
MMRSLGILVGLAVAGTNAQAQIYKYVKDDGTVVYTDSLAKLPKERRIYYNKLAEERAQKASAVQAEVDQDTAARKAAEAERARLQAEAKARNQARLQELDAEIARLRSKNQIREKERDRWTSLYRQTKQRLQERLKAFEDTQQAYQALAVQAEFALFPGQKEKKFELYRQMKALETEIDDLNRRLTVEIPEQARKAGIPPGWVR